MIGGMNFTTAERYALAESCDMDEQYLYQVLTRRREASPELCVLLEEKSGGRLMRWHLRPDKWHRIWPELRAHPAAPPIPSSSAGAPGTAVQTAQKEPA